MRSRLVRAGVLAAALSLAVPTPAAAPPGDDRRLEPFRGLGAWVDIFEDRAWRDPAGAVADMASHGVRTLYLQTSNYSQDRAVVHATGVASFLAAAHERGMNVVAWYLPGFANIKRDFRRAMAAIRYRSPAGERFDGFGLDIEASILGPPSERTKRLLSLSRRLRARAGDQYPLGAIIPSPVGIRLNEGYWPGFPYRELAETYDAFVPMGYFTYHVDGAQKVHAETVRNVEIIREQTGDATIPIHLIGGVADDASGAEVEAFVRAVREHGLIGASLYNWSLTRPHDWRVLETVPANPRQSPPLPVALPHAAPLGNVPGGDQTHPKEVVYRTGPVEGARTLRFQAYDVESGEVEILVNWQPLAAVAPTGEDAWGTEEQLIVGADVLDPRHPNVIAFVATGEHPDWTEWGVRAVSLS